MLLQKLYNFVSDKKFNEILVGSIWTLISRLSATACSFAASIFIARYYGADIVGIVAVLNSFLILSTMVTVFGTNTSLLRLIPEHITKYSPSSACFLYRKILILVVFLSVVFGIFMIIESENITTYFFSKSDISFYISLASSFVVFKALLMINTQAVRGLRLIKAFAVMQFLPQGINLLLLVIFCQIYPKNDLPIYTLLASLAFGGIVGWGIMEISFRKIMAPGDHINSEPIRKILRVSTPMFMSTSITFILGQTGVLMLSYFRTETEVGIYAIAVKMATLTTFILSAVNSMVGPKLSELFYANKLDDLFYIAKKSARLIFWMTTPLLVFLMIFGKQVLNFAFGTEFITAYPALVLLVIGQFFHSISGATGLFMNMTGNERVFRNIVASAAVFNIVMNYLLIPKHGLLGSATAAMASLVAWNIATLVYMKIKYGQTTGYFPLLLHTS